MLLIRWRLCRIETCRELYAQLTLEHPLIIRTLVSGPGACLRPEVPFVEPMLRLTTAMPTRSGSTRSRGFTELRASNGSRAPPIWWSADLAACSTWAAGGYLFGMLTRN